MLRLVSKVRGLSSIHGVRPTANKHCSSARRITMSMAGKAKEPRVQAFVDTELVNHPIIEFGKSVCPYSRAARAALISVLPDEIVTTHWIDLLPHGDQIGAYLASMTGKTTVPFVYIGGTFIGGGDETVALVETGELVPLLIAADVPVPPVLEDRRAANKGGGKP